MGHLMMVELDHQLPTGLVALVPQIATRVSMYLDPIIDATSNDHRLPQNKPAAQHVTLVDAAEVRTLMQETGMQHEVVQTSVLSTLILRLYVRHCIGRLNAMYGVRTSSSCRVQSKCLNPDQRC